MSATLLGKWGTRYIIEDGLDLLADYGYGCTEYVCTLTAIEHAAAVVLLYEDSYDYAIDTGATWSENAARKRGWIL